MSAGRLASACALALVALTGSFVAGCGEEEAVGDGPIQVTTTTNWHTDLARAIGGDQVSVRGLMGPGVDPHLYEATAGDVETLTESDIAIWNGINLEGKMEEVFDEVAEDVPVVAVGEEVDRSKLIPVTGVPGEEFDPHIWGDPELWEQAAVAVADALKELDPEHASLYERNLDDFVAEARATDAAIRRRIEGIPEGSRVLVTSHDAFSYFARAYGFEVAPIQGKSTATEATTADIERVAGVVAEDRLGAVFLETSVPQQTIDAVLAAAEQRGQPTQVGGELYGDSLGDPGSPEGTWAGALRGNANTVTEGLAR